MGALDEVLGLAAQGRRLFPCGPQTKTPLLKGWPTLASSDPATIQKWDVKYPGCNWGVATGRVSGLFVLDVDSEKGRASMATLEAHRGPLPPTLT
jgi:putative DNA primase/helicase